jgi:hypothetical protein
MATSLERLTIEASVPATDFPATTLRACLKQVSVDALDELSRSALEACFPRFAIRSTDFLENLTQLPNVKFAIMSNGTYELGEGRYRRYAGRRDLPGSRYYSVCCDESGNDGGTLCYELMSYWDSRTGFYPNLTDFTTHDDPTTLSLRNTLTAKSTLLILAYDLQDLIVVEEGFASSRQPTPALIPLQLCEVECENVLDLRRPAAQDWLAGRVGKGSIEGFANLFASLISPTPGGHLFHQKFGAWLRSHGCLGLVFPSARRDIAVDATDDRVFASDGWNFVRYDGAPSLEEETQIEPPVPRLKPADVGAEIYYKIEDGVRRWRVQGPEAGERSRINYEIRLSRKLIPRQPTNFNPFDASRRSSRKPGSAFAPLEPDGEKSPEPSER